MDGTVLDSDRVLRQRTIDAFELAASQGAFPVVTSGRKFEVVPEELRELPCIRYYVLCGGSVLYDRDEDRELFRADLSLKKVLAVYDAMMEGGDRVYFDCYHEDGAWAAAERFHLIDEIVPQMSLRRVLHETRTPVEDIRGAFIRRGKSVHKLQAIYESTEARDSERARLEALFPDVRFTTAYPFNLEACHPSASKGQGLLKLAEILGYSRSNVIAFGDGENDRDMLQLAGCGFAMANADDYVKSAADLIAPSNDDDGVARVLEAIFAEDSSETP